MGQPLFYFRLALIAVAFSCLFFARGFGQFKKVYSTDTIAAASPATFTANSLIETDIPGSELMVVGAFNSQDTGGTYRLAVYNQLLDLSGDPQHFYLYEDTTQFLVGTPKAYGACYGGNGEFYTALGTNNNQIVLKTNAAGQTLWAKKANHHEFYSLVFNGNDLVALGQDESIQGFHDFSFVKLQTDGSFVNGNRIGTMDTDSPQRMIATGDGYAAVGHAFTFGGFELMVVKADTGLNEVWGKTYQATGKTYNGQGIGLPLSGGGYVVSGRVRGGADSLFVMRIDGSGNPLWVNYYGITGATEAYNTALAVDPVSGGYLLAGTYRGTAWLRPYIFMVDSTGNLRWARDYGDPGTVTDEKLNDLIHCQADGFFYAVGDVVDIAPPNYFQKTLMVKISADSGSIPCDSALSVGKRSAQVFSNILTLEEPFVADHPYSMPNRFPLTVSFATRCSVIVGLTEGEPRTGIFGFENPSDGKLHLLADVLEGGGTLQVRSLQGTLLFEKSLEEGNCDATLPVPLLSNGLYLVTLQGDGWRYPTQRWVIQR